MQVETKYKIISISLLVLFVVGLFSVRWIVDYNNTDKIKYNGRTYYQSKSSIVDTKVSESIKTDYIDTRKKEKGMEVFAIKDNPNHLVDTVLYLNTKEGSFVVYVLSGGP